MWARRRAVVAGSVAATALLVVVQASAGSSRSASRASGAGERVGVAAAGAPGISRKTAELTAASRAAPEGTSQPSRRFTPRRMPRGFRARRLGRDALSPAGFFASPGLLGVSTSFDGPTLADAGYFPPDTDAAAGTSQ